MSDTALSGPKSPTARNLFAALQLDTRLLGMIGAFIVLCLVFNVFTDGRFLTPRNIFNLTIQTVSVAIMATGMVFVIVTRHIDLSVGALLATCSAVMAMTGTSLWCASSIAGCRFASAVPLVTTIAAGCPAAAVTHIPDPHQPHMAVSWRADFEGAKDEAMMTDKPILLIGASGEVDGLL